MSKGWREVVRMVNVAEDHREDLKALAEREDLRVSKYAKALLDAADTGAE